MPAPDDDLSDHELLFRFGDLSLPASRFDHRAHLRVAWILLQRQPLRVAVDRMCSGVRAFAAHVGQPEKYHATLTAALVRLMHARGAADREVSFPAFLARCPDLLTDARGAVLGHYSEALLDSDEARAGFVAPDREPLP